VHKYKLVPSISVVLDMVRNKEGTLQNFGVSIFLLWIPAVHEALGGALVELTVGGLKW